MSANVSAPAPPQRAGRYDAAARRQATRTQRERGCWVYIPAEELQRAGINPHAPAPFYRTHGYRRSRNGHTVIVGLYDTP